MATQVGNSVDCHNPDMVGKSFAQRYYRVLCESPENMYEFYHDDSIIDRPDCDDTMRSITTTRAIKKYYSSTDLKGSSVQMNHVVCQTSHGGCLLLVVVGSFIMPDITKRTFHQTFFLAPQGIGGYFVSIDILHFFPDRPETLPLMESNSMDLDKESMDAEEIPFSNLYISESPRNP